MPWAHWWNGSEGKLIDELGLDHFPTIYVLDPQGIIRLKEVRGADLDHAVDSLLNPPAPPAAG